MQGTKRGPVEKQLAVTGGTVVFMHVWVTGVAICVAVGHALDWRRQMGSLYKAWRVAGSLEDLAQAALAAECRLCS